MFSNGVIAVNLSLSGENFVRVLDLGQLMGNPLCVR